MFIYLPCNGQGHPEPGNVRLERTCWGLQVAQTPASSPWCLKCPRLRSNMITHINTGRIPSSVSLKQSSLLCSTLLVSIPKQDALFMSPFLQLVLNFAPCVEVGRSNIHNTVWKCIFRDVPKQPLMIHLCMKSWMHDWEIQFSEGVRTIESSDQFNVILQMLEQ